MSVFNIDDGRTVRFEIFTNRVDLAIAHTNVELAVFAAGWIDQAAAFE